LIRADIFGFTAPGQPREAASRASRDASVSHTENGLYATMWAAALIALSSGGMDPGTAVVESLRHVPPRTRLHEAIGSVLQDFDAGRDWEAAADRVDARYGDYHWVHAIPNAAMIAAAVLWSQGDFVVGVGLAVMSGRDTDSVAATVGSVLGAFVGVEGIPAHLSAPLEDRVGSALAGFDGSSISALAERTVDLARSFRPELTNDGVGS
jgi:ADP-ribosylglycohydrolase